MFPLHFFRLECMRILGFDAILHDSLYDNRDLVAFMVPNSYFVKRDKQLTNFLESMVVKLGWVCKSVTWVESDTYENNWCGSRCNTHVLGPHILLDIVSAGETVSVINPQCIPVIPNNWTVLSVSLDHIKPANLAYVAYHTHHYAAAFPDECYEVHTQILKDAKANL